jgi:hypothetical protein
MGDAARRRHATTLPEPTLELTPRRWGERPEPRRVPAGVVRVRGIVPTRSGFVVRTYDVPPSVLGEYVVHERPPDTLATASSAIDSDLYLEAQ